MISPGRPTQSIVRIPRQIHVPSDPTHVLSTLCLPEDYYYYYTELSWCLASFDSLLWAPRSNTVNLCPATLANKPTVLNVRSGSRIKHDIHTSVSTTVLLACLHARCTWPCHHKQAPSIARVLPRRDRFPFTVLPISYQFMNKITKDILVMEI